MGVYIRFLMNIKMDGLLNDKITMIRIENISDFKKGIKHFGIGESILVCPHLKYEFQQEISKELPFAPDSSWQPHGDMILVTVNSDTK